MRLRRLEVEGFAQLDRVEIIFQEGVPNVIVGPNEAGKSHLMQALYGVLFGIEGVDRYKPWFNSSAAMRGVLEFDDENGRRVCLERYFGEQIVTVEIDGQRPWTVEVGPETPVSEAGRYFALLDRWVGFSDAEVFTATTFVRQSEVVQASLKGVAPQIKSLITGTGNSDYQHALQDLRKELDSLRRPSESSSPRVIEQTQQELLELEERYREAKRREDKIAELQEKQERLQSDAETQTRLLRQKRDQLERVERLVDRENKLDRLREQFDDAQGRLNQFIERHEKLEQARVDRQQYAKAEETDLVTLLELEHRVSQAGLRLETAKQRAVSGGPIRDLMSWFILFIGLLAFISLAIYVNPRLMGGFAVVLLLLVLRFRQVSAVHAAEQAEVEEAAADLEGAEARRADVFEGLGVSTVHETLTLRKTFEHKDRSLERAQAALEALGDRKELETKFDGINEELTREQTLVDSMLENDAVLRALGTAQKRHKYFHDLKRQVEQAEQSLEGLREHEALVKRDLLIEGANEEDVPILALKIQGRRGEIARLQKRSQALGIAIEALEGCVRDFNDQYLTPVMDDVSDLFATLTGGRYTKVRLTENDLEPLVDMPGKTSIPSASLGRGVQDQLYFALRVGLIKALVGGRSVPLVLDDPYVNLDGERLGRTVELLKVLARRTQVLLFTCNPQYEQWFQPVGRLERNDETPLAAQRSGAA